MNETLELDKVVKYKTASHFNAPCDCGDKKVYFEYLVKHQIVGKVIHFGPYVEGCLNERLVLVSNTPEYFRCNTCNTLYRIDEPEVIARPSDDSVINLLAGKIVGEPVLTYTSEFIQEKLEEALANIKIVKLGKPRTV